MFRRKPQQSPAQNLTHPAVDDTDEAVAAKLRTMAGQTSNPDRASTWLSIAAAAEDGRLSPSIRREYARGTQFAK